MKKLFFEIERDGFYGTYYENPKGSDCVVIGLFGDDPNDFMAKCGAKWLHKNGVDFAAFPVNPRPAMQFPVITWYVIIGNGKPCIIPVIMQGFIFQKTSKK